ncbi:MAG: O-antigen ligase family protein, partial [Candidatus Omnitrophica bacterium]|nr:O-antigen ligase family protein [Candidatus Omnitrophota bacterium]
IAFLSTIVILADGFIQLYGPIPDFLHQYPVYKYRAPNDGAGFFRGFPTACFPFPNDLAAWILLVIMPIACVTIFDLKGLRIRWVVASVSLALFYLLFLTKARGAWVGFAVSCIYIALAKKRFWLIAVLVVMLVMPFFLRMEMANYIFGISSVSDRFFMWGTGWEIFKVHPVIGNGLNSFFQEFMRLRNDEWKGKKGAYAHNCYLQMAADTGLVGLVGFIYLMAAYFVGVGKSLKKIKDKFYESVLLGLSMGVLAFLVLGFFDTNLYSLNLATLFWSSIGVSAATAGVRAGRPA